MSNASLYFCRAWFRSVARVAESRPSATASRSWTGRAYRGRRARDQRILRVVGIFDAATESYHLYVTNVPVDRLDAVEAAETIVCAGRSRCSSRS
jgi:hypothetical protein